MRIPNFSTFISMMGTSLYCCTCQYKSYQDWQGDHLCISDFHLSLYVVNKGISDVSSFCNGSIDWLTFRPRVMYFKLSVSKDPPLLIRLFRKLLPKGFCVMLAWLCEDKKSNIRRKLRFYFGFISIADKYELMKNIEEIYFEIEAYDFLIFSLFSIYANYQF